ncbi:MAG: exosortase-associated protein EpsI, V-type [Parasphingorhabdus sp.]|uniref:exosortase-associated protein EpsI, V-type n=1 Tax=Parasphingorhabdus sp. TaxID=2709688 RepID=UPI0030028E00
MDKKEPNHINQTNGFNRRHVIIGAILAGASAIAYTRQPEVEMPVMGAKIFHELVPRKFGDWTPLSQGDVVLPPPDALRDRLYDNLVTRVYEKPGTPPVMLLLAYNNEQDGVLQVHRPEICYPVGGFQLSETRKIGIAVAGRSIPANIFTAKSPRRTEQVIYFTRLGDAFPRSWSEQRISVMRANLAGDIPDGMMMRVSVLGIDQQEAMTILTEFTREFIEASPHQLQKLLVG